MIEPDLTPSKTLAYILGCMLGDGCVTIDKTNGRATRYRVKFTVKDRFVQGSGL